MTRGFRFPRHLVFLLLGTLALAGCSDLPTKPAEMGSPVEEPLAFGSATENPDASTLAVTSTALTPTTRVVILLGGTVRAATSPS